MLRLDLPLLRAINANGVPVRPNPPFGGRNVVEMLFLRPKPLFTGREDIFAVYQIHFGSRCATESVYWYLPAKVELKKSHFGKQSLTECTLRRPPCQSELAEACESTSKTKAPVAATSLRAKRQKPIVSENKMSLAKSEGACWRARTKSSTRSRKTPLGS